MNKNKNKPNIYRLTNNIKSFQKKINAFKLKLHRVFRCRLFEINLNYSELS